MAHLRRFGRAVRDDSGATMVEYALMLAFIAAVCVAGVTLLGANANNFFTTFAGSLP